MTLATYPGLAALHAALADIERPLMREHSVKALGGTLISGRELISFDRGNLGPGPARRLTAICEALAAPAEGLALLEPMQRRAQSVHFGYEPEPGTGAVLKCYLEFDAHDAPEPDLVFAALKWRPGGAWTLSHYRSRTALDPAGRAKLVADIMPDGPLARVICRLALGPDRPVLLEVTEPGNPRRSLDITLIDAGDRVRDRAEDVATVLGGTDAARAFVIEHGASLLGHVAAGTARDGQPFGTVYHGAMQVEGPL